MATFTAGDLVCAGRFRIVSALAFGGMGSVYDVEESTVGRRFVLKVMHGELASDDDLHAQMRREARVLGRIDHLNVVRVFTAGVCDEGGSSLPFIVMEKLEGASLRQVLRAGTRIPIRAAVHATIDLLLALDHVHELGVVHCDLKPENIFLHQERGAVIPKLLDFGVVRMLARGEATARLGGTLRYASPEHVRNEAVGPRSDVYSMALVLYEMLAGRSPFHDVSGAQQIARAQLTRMPMPIPGVPPGLMNVLLRALSKESASRPRDAFAFASELRDLEQFLPGDAALSTMVIAARAKCDEPTRVRTDDTERDVSSSTMSVTNGELLTRHV